MRINSVAARLVVSALLLCSGGGSAYADVTPGPDRGPSEELAYSKSYGVSTTEAHRRMSIMVSSALDVDRLERGLGPELSGSYFDNGNTFVLMLRTTGAAKADSVIRITSRVKDSFGHSEVFSLPVKYITGGVSRSTGKAAIKSNRQLFLDNFPTMQAISYEERTGDVVILINGSQSETPGFQAKAATLSKRLGVNVRAVVRRLQATLTTLRGGEQDLQADGVTPWCTTGFVGKDASGAVGVFSAGHCGTQQIYFNDGSSGPVPLYSTTYFTPTKDYAFLQGNIDMVGEFYANNNEPPRQLTGRRTLAYTNVKMTSPATPGSFVCFYGRNSGPVYGQQCGEVTSITYTPTYPGGCSNGTYQACEANFIEVRPVDPYVMYCRGGDSGAPVFYGTIAFGIENGCTFIPDMFDQTYNMIYTSADELYADGYSFVYP